MCINSVIFSNERIIVIFFRPHPCFLVANIQMARCLCCLILCSTTQSMLVDLWAVFKDGVRVWLSFSSTKHITRYIIYINLFDKSFISNYWILLSIPNYLILCIRAVKQKLYYHSKRYRYNYILLPCISDVEWCWSEILVHHWKHQSDTQKKRER